jgi:hypothetical protein
MNFKRQGSQQGRNASGGLPGMGNHTGLPLLIIISLLMNSCTFGLLEGYRKTEGDSQTPVSWFKTDSDHLLMNTTIDLMKNHFSGLMVIKALIGGGYRVVFITEVGLKIFDMEFLPGEPVKVHYMMDALNKKILIGTLSDDLGLMLIQPPDDERPVVYDSPSAGKMVRYNYRGKRNFYEISAVTGKPVQAWRASGTSKKAAIDYFSGDGLKIDSVKIVHYHINLRMGMYRVNENPQDADK